MTRVAPLLALAAIAVVGSTAPAGAAPPTAPEKPAEITKAELQEWVKTLAADALEGRESGYPGCDRAADLLAAEYARLGLEPKGDAGTFFQGFTIPRGMKVLPTSALAATGADGKDASFDVGVDFAPQDVSAPGDVTAEAVFAGYGISAPDLGYDDYEGVDVKGKVVVVLRHAPAYQDKKSPFAPPAVLQRYAAFQAKADAAAGAGAAALVIVNDPESSTGKGKDELKPPGGGAAGKIPVVQTTWKAGKRLGSVLGVPFAKRQQQVDGKVQPVSEVLAGTKVRVNCALEADVRKVKNVLALLAPAKALTGGGVLAPLGEQGARGPETLLIGAHYDHVGVGRFGSLSGGPAGKIHNGADDNASGTSALMEIAGYLSSRRTELRRRVLFLSFSGEELGLLGSKHYVGAPVIPISDCVAMLNLDMVGRLHENRLFVGGTGTSPVWTELIEGLNKEAKFSLKLWPGGKAPSDHESFYGKDMPVLFFFTGLHGDYHRPSDDWNTLNYAGHERVARFAAAVAMDLATRPDRPPFTKCDAGGFEAGPYIGLSIDPRPDGPYVAHVDKGSPAAKAGIKEEDKVLEWNGRPIPDANAWNDALSTSKQSEKVEIVVSRKGKTRTFKVTLGST
jgi:hypothetical protein